MGDNRYGRLLLWINKRIQGSRLLSEVLLSVASGEERRAGKLRFILWNMYTGNTSYRRILRAFLSPGLQWKLTLATIRVLTARLLSGICGGG